MNKGVKKINENLKKFRIKSRVVVDNKTTHLLTEGDCLEVIKYIPDRSIDLIITDPPYNKKLDYGNNFDDNKRSGEYFSWLKRRLEDVPRILNQTGSLYLMNYPEINARILPYLENELGLKFRRWITWHYPTNIGHSKKNFTRSQRSILFLTKSNEYTFNRNKILQPYMNPDVGKIKKLIKQGKKGRAAYDFLELLDLIEMNIVDNSKKPIDVHDVDLLKNVCKDRLNKLHPCQLPLELIKRFLLVSSNKNDIILDPFAGTFSTSAVAANLGRNSIGIEINPDYLKLGLNRINKI